MAIPRRLAPTTPFSPGVVLERAPYVIPTDVEGRESYILTLNGIIRIFRKPVKSVRVSRILEDARPYTLG